MILVKTHCHAKNTSVQAFAEALNISTKTLAIITKNLINKLPAQLIAERIVLEAKRLLRFTTTLQTSEIAFRLGFADASYFVKYFKRNTGTTPASFRVN